VASATWHLQDVGYLLENINMAADAYLAFDFISSFFSTPIEKSPKHFAFT
jgi:hypothetical protein